MNALGINLEDVITSEKLIETIKENKKRILIEKVKALNTDMNIPLPADWIEGRRYYPAGLTDVPGYHTNLFMPHMVDILNWASPSDPAKFGSIIKCTQAGVTTNIDENIMGFWIDNFLGSILFMISTGDMADVRVSANIDTMIDNTGLVEHIKPHSNRSNQKRKDGIYKEMTGSRVFFAAPYGSVAKAESIPYNLIVMSELDRAPSLTDSKNQLDPEGTAEARTMTKRMYKILKESSPSTEAGNSRIYRAYKSGDQRECYLPCPECKAMQVPRLRTQGRTYGLSFKTKEVKGKPVIVDNKKDLYYKCKDCGFHISENKRSWMLQNHEWRANFPHLSDVHKSWKITSFLSPIEFMPWKRIAQEFVDTNFGKDISKLKNFVVKFLAEPFENRKEATNHKPFMDKAENYEKGKIPGNAAIITIGGDVQPDRIEGTAIGWAEGLEAWIIEHKVFHGSTERWDSESFCAFHTWATTPFLNSEGKEMKASKIGIDARYSHYRENEKTRNRAVFDFCYQANLMENNYERFMPIMGFEELKLGELVKKSKVINHPIGFRIDISTATLKSELFGYYCIAEEDSFKIHFPKMDEGWFRGFFSEAYTEVNGKWVWKKIFPRNEPLDCFIYARAMAEYMHIPVFNKAEWNQRRLEFFGKK